MRKFIVSIIMSFVFCFGVLPKAQALDPTPVGLWNVIHYFEPDLARGLSEDICFLSDGTWVSPVRRFEKGNWFQKGDRIRRYGTGIGGFNAAYFGQFSSNIQAAGEFAFFPGIITPNNVGNWIMVKVSDTCP